MRKWIGNKINEKIMQKYINIHGASGRYIVGVRVALHGLTSASGHVSRRETMPVRTGSVLKRAERPSSQHFRKSLLPLSHFYGFLIQNPWSTKIQPSKLNSVFGNVILALGSTFLPFGLRYFYKLLSLEILG
jgi:hypothetical protein